MKPNAEQKIEIIANIDKSKAVMLICMLPDEKKDNESSLFTLVDGTHNHLKNLLLNLIENSKEMQHIFYAVMQKHIELTNPEFKDIAEHAMFLMQKEANKNKS